MNSPEKLDLLNQLLKHAKCAPFYQNRLPENPLSSWDELKSIPLTTKEDLRRESPFGLIAVPRLELYQYHESFGTTGVPVSVWLTRDDYLAHAWEIGQWGVDFRSNDVVMVRFPYSISAAAHMVQIAAQWKQSCVIAAGARSSVSPASRIVMMLQKLEVTVLTCLPLQVLLIAETAEMLGFKPSRDFPHLRVIGTAGEPLSISRRRMLEEIWGVPILDHYGMTEIGAAIMDCCYGQPHPLEDYFVFELLKDDFQTNAEEGEIGNLVVTPLYRLGTPMIRFVTGDRARYMNQQCRCGKNHILQIRGRKEHTITVGDRIFDIWDLEEIISHLPCRRFWAVGPLEQGLHFVVEQEKEDSGITPQLVEELKSRYQMDLKFEVLPKGTLYDRSDLLNVANVGKPEYIYTAQEMAEKAYAKSTKI